MTRTFDFVVIGGGTSGITAASFASQLGAKVALVEKHRVGGDCTWTGCVPSKALLKVAKVAHSVRTAPEFGISVCEPTVDMRSVRAHVRNAIAMVYKHETPGKLAQDGIEVIKGAARFIDSNTIEVNSQAIRSKKFLIATGTRPIIPDILGLDGVPYVTYEQLFDNDVLPKHLVVLGAGPVGSEMSQAYRRLGSQVTLIDVSLLPLQDREAASVIKGVFEREGIHFVRGLATAAWRQRDDIVIQVGAEEVLGDMLLVATGRRPNVKGIDLEKAGVAYGAEGIHVGKSLRTNIRHIYAAGDCIGGPQYTHLAAWQGFIAARNALLPGAESGLNKIIPSTIFTDPEVAQVGLTEAEARQKFGSAVHVAHRPLKQNDRAVCEKSTDGFLKIVYKSNGAILGATIVSERAGETVTEFTIATERGLSLRNLASIIHVYPSYTMDAMRLASEVAITNLVTGMSGTVVRQLSRLARK
jgi:pyruvate/2-oxoglutarate dehydrogenase complex dihydrolipoamide dehydrogenase (E3) component